MIEVTFKCKIVEIYSYYDYISGLPQLFCQEEKLCLYSECDQLL